mmetsp:Transcript_26800/g.55440  ORF Transcript_26800/g.55440 Transcript_26800/m.55440 type:complete len:104 (-) Transcript_26800:9-320(-)
MRQLPPPAMTPMSLCENADKESHHVLSIDDGGAEGDSVLDDRGHVDFFVVIVVRYSGDTGNCNGGEYHHDSVTCVSFAGILSCLDQWRRQSQQALLRKQRGTK